MTNYFKCNNNTLYELNELTNQDTYVDIEQSIDNCGNSVDIIVLTSHELYSQTSNILLHSNVKDISQNNFQLRVTNKAVSGSGSNSNYDASFSYLAFFNIAASLFPFKINNYSLIHSGVGTTFNEKFDSITHFKDYCYFVTPHTNDTTYNNNNISLYYYTYNKNNLVRDLTNVRGFYKDSGNGDDGGGEYFGNFCWLAIHKDISSNYTLNGNPIIEVGKGTTGSDGITTIYHSLTSLNYIILLTPELYNADIIVAYNHYYNVFFKSIF